MGMGSGTLPSPPPFRLARPVMRVSWRTTRGGPRPAAAGSAAWSRGGGAELKLERGCCCVVTQVSCSAVAGVQWLVEVHRVLAKLQQQRPTLPASLTPPGCRTGLRLMCRSGGPVGPSSRLASIPSAESQCRPAAAATPASGVGVGDSAKGRRACARGRYSNCTGQAIQAAVLEGAGTRTTQVMSSTKGVPAEQRAAVPTIHCALSKGANQLHLPQHPTWQVWHRKHSRHSRQGRHSPPQSRGRCRRLPAAGGAHGGAPPQPPASRGPLTGQRAGANRHASACCAGWVGAQLQGNLSRVPQQACRLCGKSDTLRPSAGPAATPTSSAVPHRRPSPAAPGGSTHLTLSTRRSRGPSSPSSYATSCRPVVLSKPTTCTGQCCEAGQEGLGKWSSCKVGCVVAQHAAHALLLRLRGQGKRAAKHTAHTWLCTHGIALISTSPLQSRRPGRQASRRRRASPPQSAQQAAPALQMERPCARQVVLTEEPAGRCTEIGTPARLHSSTTAHTPLLLFRVSLCPTPCPGAPLPSPG